MRATPTRVVLVLETERRGTKSRKLRSFDRCRVEACAGMTIFEVAAFLFAGIMVLSMIFGGWS